MGKSTINGPCLIAMLVYQRVTEFNSGFSGLSPSLFFRQTRRRIKQLKDQLPGPWSLGGWKNQPIVMIGIHIQCGAPKIAKLVHNSNN